MKRKYNKGITLIALVITIIVLLILAGITIGTLMGENGILTRATKAQEETKKAQYKELVDIIIMEKKIERSQNPRDEEPFIKSVADAIDKKEWSKNVTICDENENTQIVPEKCNTIIVETKDGYEIIVNIDNENVTGEVVSVTKGQGKKCIVKFDANGGKGEEPEPIERRKGFSLILPNGEDLTQAGKKIVGWSEKELPKEGEDKIYACGSTYQPSQEITILYAVWAEDTVKISFNSNNDLGEMKTIEIPAKTETKLPNNTFTNGEWTFKEWNTEPRRKWN